jgi:hypothetical protein
MSATSLAAARTRMEMGVMRAHVVLGSWAVEAHKHLVDEPSDWQDVAVRHGVRLRGESPTLAELLLIPAPA